MGQYEPNDSRDVTMSKDSAPGEPPRTGFREGESRQQDQSERKHRDGSPEAMSEQPAPSGHVTTSENAISEGGDGQLNQQQSNLGQMGSRDYAGVQNSQNQSSPPQSSYEQQSYDGSSDDSGQMSQSSSERDYSQSQSQSQPSDEQPVGNEQMGQSEDRSIENPQGSSAGSYGSQRDTSSASSNEQMEQSKPTNDGAQASYGNSRDEDGQMEQDVKDSSSSRETVSDKTMEDGFLEESDKHSTQLRGDAKRPLSDD